MKDNFLHGFNIVTTREEDANYIAPPPTPPSCFFKKNIYLPILVLFICSTLQIDFVHVLSCHTSEKFKFAVYNPKWLTWEFQVHVETAVHVASNMFLKHVFQSENQRFTVLNIFTMLWRAHLWHFSISSKIKARHFMFFYLPNCTCFGTWKWLLI